MIADEALKKLVQEFMKGQDSNGNNLVAMRYAWFERQMGSIRPLLQEESIAELSVEDAQRLYNQMSVGGRKLLLQTYLGNGIGKIRAALSYLLYGDAPLAERFYNFVGNQKSKYRLKGVGKAFASTALHLTCPTGFAIWNGAIDEGLKILGAAPQKTRGEHIGETYVKVTQALTELMSRGGLPDLNITDEFVELVYHGRISLAMIEEDELAFPEGRESYKLHRSKERNPRVVELAKSNRAKSDPLLHCDICGFSFADAYGKKLGKGFIEAHHTKPLSEVKAEVETRVDDIALVCSNCHKMLHRQRPWLKMSELKALLSTNYHIPKRKE